MVTLTSAENALKTLYLGVVADQLNTNVNPLLAKISQTTSDVWGKEIRKLAPFGINGGIGAGTEDGTLPGAASNNYAQFVLTLKTCTAPSKFPTRQSGQVKTTAAPSSICWKRKWKD